MLRRILCVLFDHKLDVELGCISLDGHGPNGTYRFTITGCERCGKLYFKHGGNLNSR